jgi:hypothetical protein
MNLSSKLIQYACDSLHKEVAHFKSEYENARQLASERIPRGSVQPQNPPDNEAEKLLALADWMAKDFQQQRTAAGGSSAAEANLLRLFTDTWGLFQVAWQQQMGDIDPLGSIETHNNFIAAGNKVARAIYQVAQTKALDLIVPNQCLIVVSAGGREYSRGFETPTPYIVAPYWGHSQVWTWLSYAHEVGHHIYRNVNGLSDELKVNVAMQLSQETRELQNSRIWFNWLEEIFADLFGLMRIGQVFAQTQLLMLPYLPQPTARRVESNPLLLASDVGHPVPYLRVFLTKLAWEKLHGHTPDLRILDKETAELVGIKEPPLHVHVLDQGKLLEIPFEELRTTADHILDVILDTPLDALESTSPEYPGPRSLQAVFFNPKPQGVEKLLGETYSALKDLEQRKGSLLEDMDIDELSKSIVKKFM